MDVILKNLLHSESIAFDGIIPSNKVVQGASYKLQVIGYRAKVILIIVKNRKNMGNCIDLRMEINDNEFKF
jgi:hypothetical protein